MIDFSGTTRLRFHIGKWNNLIVFPSISIINQFWSGRFCVWARIRSFFFIVVKHLKVGLFSSPSSPFEQKFYDIFCQSINEIIMSRIFQLLFHIKQLIIINNNIREWCDWILNDNILFDTDISFEIGLEFLICISI